MMIKRKAVQKPLVCLFLALILVLSGCRQASPATTSQSPKNASTLLISVAPAPSRLIRIPANAGPTDRDALEVMPFKVTALGKVARLTRSGIVDCIAGVMSEEAAPNKNVKANNNCGDRWPVTASVPVPAVASIKPLSDPNMM